MPEITKISINYSAVQSDGKFDASKLKTQIEAQMKNLSKDFNVTIKSPTIELTITGATAAVKASILDAVKTDFPGYSVAAGTEIDGNISFTITPNSAAVAAPAAAAGVAAPVSDYVSATYGKIGGLIDKLPKEMQSKPQAAGLVAIMYLMADGNIDIVEALLAKLWNSTTKDEEFTKRFTALLDRGSEGNYSSFKECLIDRFNLPKDTKAPSWDFYESFRNDYVDKTLKDIGDNNKLRLQTIIATFIKNGGKDEANFIEGDLKPACTAMRALAAKPGSFYWLSGKDIPPSVKAKDLLSGIMPESMVKHYEQYANAKEQFRRTNKYSRSDEQEEAFWKEILASFICDQQTHGNLDMSKVMDVYQKGPFLKRMFTNDSKVQGKFAQALNTMFAIEKLNVGSPDKKWTPEELNGKQLRPEYPAEGKYKYVFDAHLKDDPFFGKMFDGGKYDADNTKLLDYAFEDTKTLKQHWDALDVKILPEGVNKVADLINKVLGYADVKNKMPPEVKKKYYEAGVAVIKAIAKSTTDLAELKQVAYKTLTNGEPPGYQDKSKVAAPVQKQ